MMLAVKSITPLSSRSVCTGLVSITSQFKVLLLDKLLTRRKDKIRCPSNIQWNSGLSILNSKRSICYAERGFVHLPGAKLVSHCCVLCYRARGIALLLRSEPRIKYLWVLVTFFDYMNKSVMIAQWNSSLSVLPVARVQFPATAEYFKGLFADWSHSVNSFRASVAENGSISPQWHHTTCGQRGGRPMSNHGWWWLIERRRTILTTDLQSVYRLSELSQD